MHFDPAYLELCAIDLATEGPATQRQPHAMSHIVGWPGAGTPLTPRMLAGTAHFDLHDGETVPAAAFVLMLAGRPHAGRIVFKDGDAHWMKPRPNSPPSSKHRHRHRNRHRRANQMPEHLRRLAVMIEDDRRSTAAALIAATDPHVRSKLVEIEAVFSGLATDVAALTVYSITEART